MPYDRTNKKLYVDTENNKGISLDNIAACIGDYRVNTEGRRDLGLLAASEKINEYAKYKPFPSSEWGFASDDEYEVARAAGNYGTNYKWTQLSDNKKLFTLTVSKYVPDGTEPRRALDFNGYRHNAKNGLKMKTESPIVASTSMVMLAMNPDEGDNITIREALAALPSVNSYSEFGFLIVNGMSFIVHKAIIGYTIDEFLEYLYVTSLTTQRTMSVASKFNLEPLGYNGQIYAYAKTSDGQHYQMSYPVLKIANGIGTGRALRVNDYNPEMKVGSGYAGSKTYNEWIDSGSTLYYYKNDFLYFNFYISNTGTSAQSSGLLSMVITIDGTRYSTPIFLRNSDQTVHSIAAGSQFGLSAASSEGYLIIDMTGLTTILGGDTSAMEVTFQVYCKDQALIGTDVPISSPMTLKIACNGYEDDNAGTIPRPDLTPTPPEWGELELEV